MAPNKNGRILLLTIACMNIISAEALDSEEEFKFDEKGNLLPVQAEKNPEPPFNFLKLVASKVRGASDHNDTLAQTDEVTEEVKRKPKTIKEVLVVLKALHAKMAEVKTSEEKSDLRNHIIAAVTDLEDLLKSSREGIVSKAEDYDEVSSAISDSLSDTAKLRKESEPDLISTPMTSTSPPTTEFEPLVIFQGQRNKTGDDDMFEIEITSKPQQGANDEETTADGDDHGGDKAKEKALKSLLSEKTNISSTSEEATTSAKTTTTEDKPQADYENEDMDAPVAKKWRSAHHKGSKKDTLATTTTEEAIEAATSESSSEAHVELSFFPWETPICEDKLDNCEAFEDLCSILEIQAYRKCRKTCKLCYLDNPEAKIFQAKLANLGDNASMTLTQTNPDAPTFMTLCIGEESFAPNATFSAVIHSFGEVSDGGSSCHNFGPHFNPFGTLHGRPADSTKHVGDLGMLEFGSSPEDWPEGVAVCKMGQTGAYGMFDHINLYSEASPENRPVAIYKGEAPLHGSSEFDLISCGKLAVIG